MQLAPTWWFVRTSPVSETKEPEPPLLNRTEARRTWSSHALSGAQWYFVWRSFAGTSLNGHIPSSARTGRANPAARARHSNPNLLFIISPVLVISGPRPLERPGKFL